MTDIANSIYQMARDCGFDNCGIIRPEALLGSEQRLKERIERVPSSAHAYANLDIYKPVEERFPWAKSIIVLTMEHGRYRYPKEMRGRYGKALFLTPEEGRNDGWDRQRFEQWLTSQGFRWEGGYGSSPVHDAVPVRYAALKAGLGIVRKNNFLYTQRGSFVGLAAYITDCDCELIQHESLRPCSDKCNLCRRACPTGALCDAYTMDPLRCVSLLTTFGKGMVPDGLSEQMFGEWMCGCDACQDACPYNRRHDWDEGEPFSNLDEIAPRLAPSELLKQSDDFIEQEVIPKSDNHLLPGEAAILRRAAERALRNKEFRKRQQTISN